MTFRIKSWAKKVPLRLSAELPPERYFCAILIAIAAGGLYLAVDASAPLDAHVIMGLFDNGFET
jgi:hypothetical protein